MGREERREMKQKMKEDVVSERNFEKRKSLRLSTSTHSLVFVHDSKNLQLLLTIDADPVLGEALFQDSWDDSKLQEVLDLSFSLLDGFLIHKEGVPRSHHFRSEV